MDILSPSEIKKYGLEFRKKLNALVEKLRHLRIISKDFSFKINRFNEEENDILARDIINYILLEDLTKHNECE